MGTIYFAIVDPIQANVTIKARGNFSALETKEIIEQVEERFMEVEGIKNVYLRSGSNWWESGSDRVGGGFIEMRHWNLPKQKLLVSRLWIA